MLAPVRYLCTLNFMDKTTQNILGPAVQMKNQGRYFLQYTKYYK
jgi:hypothetical protein